MAFERIPSGYPGVDEVFDYIRMGDNVVWQVRLTSSITWPFMYS